MFQYPRAAPFPFITRVVCRGDACRMPSQGSSWTSCLQNACKEIQEGCVDWQPKVGNMLCDNELILKLAKSEI